MPRYQISGLYNRENFDVGKSSSIRYFVNGNLNGPRRASQLVMYAVFTVEFKSLVDLKGLDIIKRLWCMHEDKSLEMDYAV